MRWASETGRWPQVARFSQTASMLALALAASTAGLVMGMLSAEAAGVPAPAQGDDPVPGEYRVVDGRVDRGTYQGWRLFHTQCVGCHGVGAVGTDQAPNLLLRIPAYTPRGFATKVLTSYRIAPLSDPGGDEPGAEQDRRLEDIVKGERRARGQPVMPAWNADAEVPPHVLDLYAYLSARADDAIGPGRPVPIARHKR